MDFGRTSFLPAEAALGPTESTSENALLPGALADLWAGRVRASMRKTFTGVLETGIILLQAKVALPHGQWLPMLGKARLKPRTAQVWMAVACNRRFANASPDSLLPPSATTLNLISRLPEDVYQRLLADGTINSTVSRTAIAGIIRRLAQAEDEKRSFIRCSAARSFPDRSVVVSLCLSWLVPDIGLPPPLLFRLSNASRFSFKTLSWILHFPEKATLSRMEDVVPRRG
jgi:hypothetical protein